MSCYNFLRLFVIKGHTTWQIVALYSWHLVEEKKTKKHEFMSSFTIHCILKKFLWNDKFRMLKKPTKWSNHD